MDERELEYEEAIKRLADLFSDDPSAPPSRGRRKYLLEYEDGEPVFHLMGSAIKWAILAGALNVRVIEAAYDSALISEATVPASAKETPSHPSRCAGLSCPSVKQVSAWSVLPRLCVVALARLSPFLPKGR
jgi:hypothetical protein